MQDYTFCFSLFVLFFYLFFRPSARECAPPNLLFSASWQGQGSLFYRVKYPTEVLSHPPRVSRRPCFDRFRYHARDYRPQRKCSLPPYFTNHYPGVGIYVYVYFRAYNETPENRTRAWTWPAASHHFYSPHDEKAWQNGCDKRSARVHRQPLCVHEITIVKNILQLKLKNAKPRTAFTIV